MSVTVWFYHPMVIYVQEEEEETMDPYYLSEADIKWLWPEEEEEKKKPSIKAKWKIPFKKIEEVVRKLQSQKILIINPY